MSKRLYYSISEVKIDTSFKLNQCYCSCGLDPTYHDKSCPNYGKVDEQDGEVKVELIITGDDNKELGRYEITAPSKNCKFIPFKDK